MRIHRALVLAAAAVLVAVAVAAPLTAQEWQVARERFTFVGTRLAIDIDVEAPGSLRLIRGEPGTIRVASRARQGFTTSGLADGDRLTLGAAGAGPVDYLVSVPENAFVNVRLPGRSLGERVARGQTGQWEWNATERPERAPVTEWLPEPGPGDRPFYTTFVRDRVPEEVSVPDLETVARVSVRIEGDRFRVYTSRPLAMDEGSPRSLVIIPARPPMDLVLAVPPQTETFTLRLGGRTALIVEGSTVTTLCVPLTEQRLSNDRRWFTFNPLGGALECGDASTRRHGG